MTAIVRVRAPHHYYEGYIFPDKEIDHEIKQMLEERGIKEADFTNTIEKCYHLHEPIRDIQTNASKSFKFVAICFITALFLWTVCILATAVYIPLTYRWIIRPVYYLVFIMIHSLLVISSLVIERNVEKDKSAVWSKIERLVGNQDTIRSNLMKISVIKLRRAQFVEVLFQTKGRFISPNIEDDDPSDEFIEIDLMEDSRPQYYTSKLYSRLNDE
jgi:hypothetical protein